MSTRYATKKSATKKRAVSKKHKKKKKQLPVCTAKDLRKSKKHRRKCRVVVKHRPSPTGAVAAPPATSAAAGAWPAAVDHTYDGLTVWDGAFDRGAATRLLYRAGFGPAPGQADAVAALGLKGAVSQLMAGGDGSLVGPAPSGTFLVGGQFAPADVWGHGHLQWLDRMIRSNNPLQERMALVLHDWFATSQSGVELKAMGPQIDLFRRSALGSLRQLLQDVTIDPAMLQWLSGLSSTKTAPNENYGREVMELFTLGADRGAYTETDVKELARCLTGWRADWDSTVGYYNYRFDNTRHDNNSKTLFAGTAAQVSGNLGVTDAINAVVNHPMHPSFVVLKLWSYFIPSPPAAGTQAQLESLYRSSGEQLGPLIRAILVHPDLYTGPSMVKPPVVHLAGQLRARRRGIDTDAWTWICSNAGQLLWQPPNVSGWNDNAWLSTSTMSARWTMAQYTSAPSLSSTGYSTTESSADAVASALAFWGNPQVSSGLLGAVNQIAAPNYVKSSPYGNAQNFNAVRQNTLRQMLGAAPDAQVS